MDGATVQAAERVLQKARSLGRTLGTAESCTGGLVAAALTAVPGSSDCVLGSIVSYAYAVKEQVLGVPASWLESEGAVTARCAEAMAAGAVRVLGCDVAVSVTGIAGPGGSEPGKPVGTVWIGVCDAAGACRASRFLFDGDRGQVRAQAVREALRLLDAAL